jgi:hypothetical protein
LDHYTHHFLQEKLSLSADNLKKYLDMGIIVAVYDTMIASLENGLQVNLSANYYQSFNGGVVAFEISIGDNKCCACNFIIPWSQAQNYFNVCTGH